MATPPKPAGDPALRKLVIMFVLAVLVGAALLGNMFFKPPAPTTKPDQPKDLFADVGQTDEAEPKPKPDYPAAALKKVKDDTLLEAGPPPDGPGHDQLRTWLMAVDRRELIEKAEPAPSPPTMRKRADELRAEPHLLQVRGTITRITSAMPTPHRPSQVNVVFHGRLRTRDGHVYAFESFLNPHSVSVGERVVLRGVFYRFASLLDDKSQPLPPAPLLLTPELPPDYEPYIKKIEDGLDVHRTRPYWYLVRKVMKDLPTVVQATTIDHPTPEQLADRSFRDGARGKYIAVEGKLTELSEVPLDASNNRAFLNKIWEGQITDDDGRVWCFDCVTNPVYEAFLRAHRVRLVGAFALRQTYTDDQGEERTAPYLVCRDLELAVEQGEEGRAVVPFVGIPGLLAAVEDDTESRDVAFQYLWHKLSRMSQEEIDSQSDRDFNLHKIVTKERREEMRGQIIHISGRLMRVEPFELVEEGNALRVNPSGVNQGWRVYIATGTHTIYTVDLLEPPDPDIKPMRSEVNVNAAFWQVHTFRNKEDKLEKSPWLIGRGLDRRQPVPQTGLNTFAILVMALIGVILVVLMIMGRGDLASAEQARRERVRKRVLATAAHADGVPTADTGVHEKPAATAGDATAGDAPASDAPGSNAPASAGTAARVDDALAPPGPATDAPSPTTDAPGSDATPGSPAGPDASDTDRGTDR